MRRVTAVILGTMTGTALMVGAKVGNGGMDLGADDVGTSAVTVSGGDGAGPAPAPSAASTPGKASGGSAGKPSSGAKSTPKSTAKTTAKPTAQPTAQPTATATPKPTATKAPSGPKDGTYSAQAPVRSGRYGTLSMTVTISGNKITKIAASENGGETNCYHSACPKLTTEALSAQSASIATVSGATYTSQAYKAALTAVLKTANG